MIATVIRIAKRMNIHDEASNSKCNYFEAEMRRRLWWSLVIFDHRICEMSDYKETTLAPTWDCKAPVNANDQEMWPDMKNPPSAHEQPTEALFAVVRSEMAECVRQSTYHINFINPSLNAIAQPKISRSGRNIEEDDELMAMEKTIEGKFLAFCDPDNPIHFMTIWTARGYLARNRLLEHYSRQSTSSVQLSEEQKNATMSYALSMLDCDTKLRTSPLTKGFRWLLAFHVPAIAFHHILNSLRERPIQDCADRAWDAMSSNYEARTILPNTVKQNNLIFFTHIVLQTWERRETLCMRQKKLLKPPQIVTNMRNRMRQASLNLPQSSNGKRPSGAFYINSEEFKMSAPIDFESFNGTGLEDYGGVPGLGMMDADMDPFWSPWAPIDWSLVHAQGW
jgi:hypothetical protein